MLYGKPFRKQGASGEFGASLDQSALVFCKLLQLRLFGSKKVAKHEISKSVLDAGVLRVPGTLVSLCSA